MDTILVKDLKNRVTVNVAEKGATGPQGPQGPAGIQGPSSGGGSNYALPVATSTTLGGVIIGGNLSITSNGVLSAQPGGNVTSLAQLSDAQISSLSPGDLLSYDQSIFKWVNIKQSVVTDGGNF
jgi:hypothetical protein